jgi:chromosome segregation ATPase
MPKTTQSSNTYDDLRQHLQTQADVQVAIDQTCTELNQALAHKANCQQQAESLNMQLQQRRDAAESAPSHVGQSSAPMTSELDELNDQLKGKQAEVVRAEQTAQDLHENIRALQAHPLFLEGIGADAVLAHQQNRADAADEVGRLNDITAEHQARVAQAQNYQDPVDPLLQQREEILAGIAVGETDQADLAAIDQRIDDETKRSSKDRASAELTITESAATIKGLARRMEKANLELNRLQQLKADVMNNYLRSEAEAVGKEYVKLAGRLIDAHGRLVGLNLMLPNERGVRYGSNGEIHIPGFAGLAAFRDFDGRPGNYTDLMGAEGARLHKLGIDL